MKARRPSHAKVTHDDIAELFMAVGGGNRVLVSEMLRWRPELARARDPSSLSVLQFARYMEQHEILAMLIDQGPPLDVFEAATIDDAQRMRELLDANPALASAYSDDGFTPLHFAAYFGSTAAMHVLLECGARTEAVSRNFLANMPLHAAAAGGHVDAMRTLLQAGADPNARQHGGFTALMTAAFANRRDLAELLIAFNVDAGARNDEGKTAADAAAGLGNMELAARLRLGERHVERDHLHASRGQSLRTEES